jgi:protoheme ferro-lyase
MSERHVVLLTYGEPPTADFGRQLAYSWRILWDLTRLVAPIPPFVIPMIAVSRARLRVKTWKDEGYGSPIEAITRAQANALQTELSANGSGPWRAHVAYEFRRPLLAETLTAMPAGAQVAIVPMYAAESEFTHDIARRAISAADGAVRRAAAGKDVRVVPALDPETLADLSARHIEAELARLGVRAGADTALVLAAHGTLLEPPRPMNTGREGTEAIARGITRRLAPRFGRVQEGWLNHTMGGEWTKPAADVAVRDLAAAGFKKIVYFPYGFLADNAESQLEGRVLLRAQWDLEEVHHIACLNASPALAKALADAVRTTCSSLPIRPAS